MACIARTGLVPSQSPPRSAPRGWRRVATSSSRRTPPETTAVGATTSGRRARRAPRSELRRRDPPGSGVHRPLRGLADPHARAGRPRLPAGRVDVGRRRNLASLGLVAARHEDRHDRPEQLGLPGRHEVLARAEPSGQADRDAVLVEGGADASGSGRPTPGPRTSTRRPSSRSVCPTPAACRTRSRRSASARSATTARTTSCSASRRWGSRCRNRRGRNLEALALQGLLTQAPSASATVPGDPTTSASLAFLHANCGTSCHNRNTGAEAGQTGLFMKLTVDATGALPSTAQATDTWLTAYKVPSIFTPGGTTTPAAGAPDSAGAAARWGAATGGGFYRLEPGNLSHSMIPWRAGRRDGVTQMPPIATASRRQRRHAAPRRMGHGAASLTGRRVGVERSPKRR